MTTPEEARTKEIQACDSVLSAPWIVQRLIGAEGRRLANANRRFWQNADAATLTLLAGYLDAEPSSRDVAEAPDAIAPNSRWWRAGTKAHVVVICVALAYPDRTPSVVFADDAGNGAPTVMAIEDFLARYRPEDK